MSDASFAGAALDFPTFAMVARVLRPLTWFGMMEHSTRTNRPHLGGTEGRYRKTPLFDEVLSFEDQARWRLDAVGSSRALRQLMASDAAFS